MRERNEISKLSDENLLKNFSHIVLQERKGTVDVIVHLAEIYKRRLFAREGYSSLFSYIQDKYHYSGSASYRRIQAARLSLRFPMIINLLISGKLNLVAICLIEPHITPENGKELIQKAIDKTKQDIEYLLGSLFQREEKTHDKIRRLPVIKKVIPVHPAPQKEPKRVDATSPKMSPSLFGDDSATTTAAAAVKRSENMQIETKTIEIRKVKIEFIADQRVARKIERAKQILRHKFPKGRLEDILNEALDVLLEKKDPERKFERSGRKENVVKVDRIKSRYIPLSIKREVWKRDRGACTFVSPGGKQCRERSAIQFDHVRPWALGGDASIGNLRLLCGMHNRYRAVKTFGQQMT